MNLKKLLLIASIFQCSNIALAADENLPIPSKPSLDRDQQQILSLGSKVAQGGVDGLKAEATSSMNAGAVGIAKSYLEKYFPTVELQLNMFDYNKTQSGILIVAPLSDPDDVKNTLFTQDSVYHQNNRTTINLGLGYRRLEMDNKLMLGVNAFYDHEFPYNNARTSIGLEARSTVGEINFNQYWGASGWRDGANGLQERALGGTDLEAGVPLPYVNWAKLYVRGFIWYGVDGVNDLKGNDVSLRAQVPILQGLTFEAGHRTFNDSTPSENFLKLSYNVMDLLKAKSSELWISESAYSIASMEEHRYDKVRRENIIVNQTRSTNDDANGNIEIGGY